MKRRHENTKTLKCDSCDKQFKIMKDLKTHVQIVHEKSKSFRCDFCEKTFSLKGNLNNHIKVLHRNEKDFPLYVSIKNRERDSVIVMNSVSLLFYIFV